MEMLWDNVEDNPNWEGGIDLNLYMYQAQAEWTYRFDKTLANSLNVGLGMWGGHAFEGSQTKQDWKVWPLMIRDELTWNPGKYFVLRVGTDTEMRLAKMKMRVPGDYGLEGDLDYSTSTDRLWLDWNERSQDIFPALYTEFELTAIPRTRVIYGLRFDYFSQPENFALSPRFTVRHHLFPRTVLKAGLGLFNQHPGDVQSHHVYGNPDLELPRAIHVSAGVEQRLFENIELGLEGFFKQMDNLVTSSDEIVERDGELELERFDNDGVGKVYGMELQIKHHPTKRFFGWVAYTLMKSERIDEPGGEPRPFSYDQTHILTVVGSLKLGWGIDVGLRFRVVSGNPYTPVISRMYDADGDIYQPIYGRINSSRMPTFHQLDLRIDKKWQWRLLALTVYLDVQNVYNHENVEGFVHSYDYSEKQAISGLPIIPSLGLKLEY